MEPISAVAGAVSSLSSLLGAKGQQKQQQLQFNNNLTNSILGNRYAQNAAQQNQINQDKNQKRTLVNGVLIFAAVLVLVLVWTLVKEK